ncbi:MAG: hypothetical protein IIY32_00195, partial [Thermoguttaceae bacterium]|nr:hypothetical protein [Thermoguttaceae bacterium]
MAYLSETGESASYRVSFADFAVADPDDPNLVVDPDSEVGKPYRGWQEGELDLHIIHTGAGDNAFHVFPDGTTVLLDAGD